MTGRRNWGIAGGVLFVVAVGSFVGVLGGRMTQRAPRASGMRVVVLDVPDHPWMQDAIARALAGAAGLSVVSIEELHGRQTTLLRGHRTADVAAAIAALDLDGAISARFTSTGLHLDVRNPAGQSVATSDGGLDVAGVFAAARALAPRIALGEAGATPPPTVNVDAYGEYAAGVALWDGGDVDGAVIRLRRAVALDEGFSAAWALLASAIDVVGGSGAGDAAVHAQKGRLRLNGFEAILVDGLVALTSGRTEEALDAFRRATVEYPEERGGHFWLGRTYHRRVGAHDEALRHLETARRIAPDWLPVTEEIADAWVAMKDRKHAAQALRGYLVLMPDDVKAKDLLASVGAPPAR